VDQTAGRAFCFIEYVRKNVMKKMVFIIIAAFVALVIAVLFIGRIIQTRNFQSEIEELFANHNDMSGRRVDLSVADTLPEPVRKYFRRALADGMPYLSCARLRHTGKFKTGEDNDWMDIRGEQYFVSERPGFLWKGETTLFTARDMYINGWGRLAVSLFSAIPIAEEEGRQTDQGELIRWLGESVLFPTNLLPRTGLRWTAIDSSNARVSFTDGENSVEMTFHFNEENLPEKVSARRYRDGNLHDWYGRVSDYKEIGSVAVPTHIEAVWDMPGGDYVYAKFDINKIEYNHPGGF
jgi:hypothetical protein